ncbi:MAG: hypothetical protein CMJ48_09970 [Planctomycetaceae bacterium]|nr:hypothetical protein [Planctomycetaceae bacterium]
MGRDMISSLIRQECVTDASTEYTHNDSMTIGGLPDESLIERRLNRARTALLSRVTGQHAVELKLTHFGRIRLSELKQALRSGREREPFGILWDTRHWEQDLQVATLEASEKTPLAFAFLVVLPHGE